MQLRLQLFDYALCVMTAVLVPSSVVLGQPPDCDLRISRLTATALSVDEVDVAIEMTNSRTFDDARFDAVPNPDVYQGTVAGHLEFYLSLDKVLNAGDLPLESHPVGPEDETVSAGETRTLHWRIRIPRVIDPQGAQLLLVAHSVGLIRGHIVRAEDHAFTTATCDCAVFAVPDKAAPKPPPTTRSRTSRTVPPAGAKPVNVPARQPLRPVSPNAADYAVIPVHSRHAGWTFDSAQGHWWPRPGGLIVKNIGATTLNIGPGEGDELVRQLYAGQPKAGDETDLLLRPAGGAVLIFPPEARLAPGDVIVIVLSEERERQQNQSSAPEPLADQVGALIGLGKPERLDAYPLAVWEIKSRAGGDLPLFSRKAYLHLPPTVWVRKGQ